VKLSIKNIWKRAASWVNPVLGVLHLIKNSEYNPDTATKLSTVYRCVNLLSDSIASLPLLPYRYKENWKYVDYESNLYLLLNIEPNPFSSPFIFKKLMVLHLLLKGSAYILIERAKMGTITSLTLLDPDLMVVQVVGGDIKYFYSLNGATYDRSQIIHLLNYTTDGLTGKSTILYAAESLGIARASERHAKNFWKSGGSMSGILSPKEGGGMTKEQGRKAKESLVAQLNSDIGGESSSIVVLGDGLEYQPISINPKDSQLLESRQFNVIEICRFFNVPPALAYSETGKFSTAEQQSIDFLNNSLTPLIEKIESEMYRKLFLRSEWPFTELKFDVENIMRLDATTRADYYTKLHQVGGFTTNEIREKLNSAFPVKGGNRAFIAVNLQPTDALISEQEKVNPDAPIDKQVKKTASDSNKGGTN